MAKLSVQDTAALEAFPPAPYCRLINFDKANVKSLSMHIHYLIVQGEKPYVNMKVSLNPKVYVTKPDYWEYDVIGCTGGILLPSVTPYVSVANVSFLRGTKGIVVVGANKRVKIDIAGGSNVNLFEA